MQFYKLIPNRLSHRGCITLQEQRRFRSPRLRMKYHKSCLVHIEDHVIICKPLVKQCTDLCMPNIFWKNIFQLIAFNSVSHDNCFLCCNSTSLFGDPTDCMWADEVGAKWSLSSGHALRQFALNYFVEVKSSSIHLLYFYTTSSRSYGISDEAKLFVL